jgi:hypothetical protein
MNRKVSIVIGSILGACLLWIALSASVCRSDAWSHDTRVCVNGWQGNFLRERARLRDACPGTVR